MKIKTLFTALALMCLIGSISVATAQVTKIGTGLEPAVYGSKVTWSDTAGSIHIYDLTTKKTPKLVRLKHPIQLFTAISWYGMMKAVEYQELLFMTSLLGLGPLSHKILMIGVFRISMAIISYGVQMMVYI